MTVVREIRIGTSTSASPHGNRKPHCEDGQRNQGETEGQGPEVGRGGVELIFALGAGRQGDRSVAVGEPGSTLRDEGAVTSAVQALISGDLGGADDDKTATHAAYALTDAGGALGRIARMVGGQYLHPGADLRAVQEML